MEELLTKLKNIESKINTAKAQKTVRKEQLADITPKKKQIEAEVKEKLNCSIKELPELQKRLQSELSVLITKIETKMLDESETTEEND